MNMFAGRGAYRITALAATLSVALASTPTSAQAIRTTLSGPSMEQPVAGALVLLTDTLGREWGRLLTGESGRVAFDPPPGVYRLRVLRIGFTRWDAPVFTLRRGDTLRTPLAAPETPVVLSGLSVEVERRCRVRLQDGSAAATLWEEASKVLEAIDLTVRRRLYRFETVSYTRNYTHPGASPTDEVRSVGTGNSSWPFESVPAESLAARGYLHTDDEGVVRYYGPDLRVFFSDAFLSTHCFRVRAASDTMAASLVGLSFEPVADRRLIDIAGVLWLDANSAELRDLEFHYTNLGGWAGNQAGGEVTFARLPTKAWVVRKWYIRKPVPLVRQRMATVDNGLQPLATVDTMGIAGFQEAGAWVKAVLSAGGARIATYPDPL